MAIISKILSLPSATQYNQVTANVTSVLTSGAYGTTPVALIEWTNPINGEIYGGDPAGLIRAFNYKNDTFSTNFVGVWDTVLNYYVNPWNINSFTSPRTLTSSLTAGKEYIARGYTTANGTTVAQTGYTFTAMTSPDNMQNLTASGSGSSYTVSWNDFSFNVQWGGEQIDANKKWHIQLFRFNSGSSGSFTQLLSMELPKNQLSYTQYGLSSATYFWNVGAKNTYNYGSKSSTTSYTVPSANSSICTVFDRNVGECFVVGTCCPTYSVCSGSSCIY